MSNFSEYIDPSWEFGGDRPCDIDNTSYIHLPLTVSDSIVDFHDGNINMSELIEQFDKSGINYIYDELTGLVDIIEPMEPRDCPHFDMG